MAILSQEFQTPEAALVALREYLKSAPTTEADGTKRGKLGVVCLFGDTTPAVYMVACDPQYLRAAGVRVYWP